MKVGPHLIMMQIQVTSINMQHLVNLVEDAELAGEPPYFMEDTLPYCFRISVYTRTWGRVPTSLIFSHDSYMNSFSSLVFLFLVVKLGLEFPFWLV